MAPKQKHRKPVIDAALTLFRQAGYSATRINDIVELSDAPKGSLYHYFPQGKPSIAVAAVEEAARRVCNTLAELSEQSRSSGELLAGHAELLGRWMRESGWKDGCPMTTVLLELAPANRAVTVAGRNAYTARRNILGKKLEHDGFSNRQASDLASLCTSAIQGALIEARVQRSSKPLQIAAEQLALMLQVMPKSD